MSAVLNAPWIARQATDLLAQRGHAWLLQGPSGLGQYELALALVSAWVWIQLPNHRSQCCFENQQRNQLESHWALQLGPDLEQAILLA